MSDQPKPTTGEWTETFVHNMAVRGDFVGLRDAHNAALAAERDERAMIERSRDAWQGQVAGLAEQLAAEREKVQELSELLDACREIRRAQQEQINSDLAARTRVKQGK